LRNQQFKVPANALVIETCRDYTRGRTGGVATSARPTPQKEAVFCLSPLSRKDQPFGDVIASAPTRKQERALAAHPSLKPQAFLRKIVRAVLPLGEGTVLDPFAGAGSTLAAAEAVGYVSIGIEKDARYFDVARRGMPKLTAMRV